jgi:thioesterase domain-containing protein
MSAGLGDEWASIDEMARNYAEIITCKQPNGGLQLAGFSAGGVFALATASELERRGRSVSLVGLIETPVAVLDPACPREIVLRNLIAEVYDHFTGESGLYYQRETGSLSDSMMDIAKRVVANADEAAQLSLVLNWLSSHGVAVDSDIDSSRKRYFEIFIRHANLIDITNFEPLNAPVWYWRAGASRLTNSPITQSIRERITHGGFTEEIVDGRHFEVMHLPLVKTLAARMANALQVTEKICVDELSAKL